MPITAPPDIPLITDPSTFAVRAQDWVVWQADELYPFLDEGASLLGLSLSATSVTSNTVGTGSKSFTVETGKGFIAGSSLVIARTAAPANRMFVVVTSYNSGTGALVVNSQAFEGSGTFTDWSISPSFNGLISTAQITDLSVTNAKLANAYINDLTTVTLDASSDFLAIADASDSGNKKKGLLPAASTTVSGVSELATTAETALRTDTSRVVTPESLQGLLVAGAVVTLTNQTSVDFTGIPTWAKRIVVILTSGSTNGTSVPILQLGDAGGVETTGYLGTASTVSATASTTQFTTGFAVNASNAATAIYDAIWILSNISSGSNTWMCNMVSGREDSAATSLGGGAKTLSADLDRIRVTTVNGTDQYDTGFINIFYE
jgi:hypothetical protein